MKNPGIVRRFHAFGNLAQKFNSAAHRQSAFAPKQPMQHPLPLRRLLLPLLQRLKLPSLKRRPPLLRSQPLLPIVVLGS